MNRVVVTGVGVITSIGEDVDTFWDSCINGKSGITKIVKDKLELLTPQYGGQIHNFDPGKYIFENDFNSIGRGTQLLIGSLRQAIQSSKLKKEDYQLADLFVGTTMGEVSAETTNLDRFLQKKSEKAFLEQNQLKNMLVYASKEFDIRGSGLLNTNACAAGNYSTIQAFEQIRNGKNKIAISAGADPFATIAYYGFNRLNAISPDKCRPFDKNRKGMQVAEGSACLILEDLEHALERGADILAEIVGYGVSSDAFHITAPHPKSSGIIRATKNALNYAKLAPSEIDYISAHGTGTYANDKVESFAINEIFGENTPVSSIKSMLGHSMGAASAIESVVSCLAIRDNVAPPTINFETPDEECRIDCIPNVCREMSIKTVVNNSYAFGGTNASVIFKEFSK
ncbi:beta-ketoacyl-[acyl-carrier-protein] synthase family protein [Sporosarcina limicola]|uniref:Nodulation protein E n=1 Tax=Sporosarcina limicola TaxID=34101 RepID=A0A927ML19_9BACL|nr:beta-ketoacyl-[acyl-carrier-protein] synthase family protein [Sporosarcina limicola]MBE1555097.1 3-oxoacyl-[acyl-carrier-protein] synthase II [Sporosarcina limicola]